MKDKRARALELLRQSKERLELLRVHFENMDFATAEDLAVAQANPYDYGPFRDFNFLVHQLDLSTEGVRQIREMGQIDVLAALDANVDGDVGDFIALHKHLFRTYDCIDVDELWGTVTEDVPMMVHAIGATLEQLGEQGVPANNATGG